MGGNIFGGKIKRVGYIFRTWIGDHGPRHVHVIKGDVLILKWNLETHEELGGRAPRRLRKLLEELEREGLL